MFSGVPKLAPVAASIRCDKSFNTATIGSGLCMMALILGDIIIHTKPIGMAISARATTINRIAVGPFFQLCFNVSLKYIPW